MLLYKRVMSGKNSQTDLNKYQKKTDKQHILDNPDTYIGSVELVESEELIYDPSNNCIKKKIIKYNPGLYKLFDEGIVNCRDHVIRMEQAIASNSEDSLPVTYIDIGISDDGIITMINDGNGIDIAEHPEYKIWIPELIFGHLRTSTNYDKTEKKIDKLNKDLEIQKEKKRDYLKKLTELNSKIDYLRNEFNISISCSPWDKEGKGKNFYCMITFSRTGTKKISCNLGNIKRQVKPRLLEFYKTKRVNSNIERS